MEQAVALVVVSEGIYEQQSISTYLIRLASGTIRIKEGPVKLDITHIKELIIFESVLSTGLDVWFDVIEFTKASGEVEVCLICKAGLPEDDDAILIPVSVLSNTGAQLRASTTYLRKGSLNLGKDLISDGSREVNATYLRCERGVQLLDFDVVEGRGILFRNVGHFASFLVLMLVTWRYIQACSCGSIRSVEDYCDIFNSFDGQSNHYLFLGQAFLIREVAHT